MPMLHCYVDEETLETLRQVSRETRRTVEDLAESAISDAACQARRDRPALADG